MTPALPATLPPLPFPPLLPLPPCPPPTPLLPPTAVSSSSSWTPSAHPPTSTTPVKTRSHIHLQIDTTGRRPATGFSSFHARNVRKTPLSAEPRCRRPP